MVVINELQLGKHSVCGDHSGTAGMGIAMRELCTDVRETVIF